MRECSSPQTSHVSRVTCHMSCVICHVSYVTCHISRVICHVSRVTCPSFFGQSGEAYRWRVCYQRGLPHLVFYSNVILYFDYSSPVQPVLSIHRGTMSLKFIGAAGAGRHFAFQILDA